MSSAEIFSDLKRFWYRDPLEQKLFDDFSENTITNHYMPYGVAPNFLIDGEIYCVPMVIEESSVVAAASNSAKYWLSRGGFQTEFVSTTKTGQIHFNWTGKVGKLERFINESRPLIMNSVSNLIRNMKERGGGIKDLFLRDCTSKLKNYYQLVVKFETCDAMGANFINSVLECVATEITSLAKEYRFFNSIEKELCVTMAILTNYAPECLVRVKVECLIEDLKCSSIHDPYLFAERFEKAIKISKVDKERAVTHNKGIFNGIDSVVIATGNDFRAVEASGHAYASRDGNYRGLTDVDLSNGKFKFSIEVPISVGTVGGLTSLHPTASASLELLNRPSASKLMTIIASVGLATNFAAVKSLVTTGIQKGHMKMHLLNICRRLGATEMEIEKTKDYFFNKIVSVNAVDNFLTSMRIIQ